MDTKKIFVLDDNEDILDIFNIKLADLGYTPYTFNNKNDFFKTLTEITPDIVILDVHMPEMSGYRVCEELRSMEHLKNTPIIFLTSNYKDHKSIIKGFEAGANDYLQKPVHIEELKIRFETLLKAKQQNDTLENLNAALKYAQIGVIQQEKLNTVSQFAIALVEKIQIPVIQLSVNLEMISNFSNSIKLAYEKLENQLVKGEKGQDEPLHLLEEVQNLISNSTFKLDSIKEVIQKLRFFSEGSQLKKDLVDVNGAIEFAVMMVEEILKNRCRIELNLGEIPFIVGHKQEIIQMILSFLNNAGESFSEDDSEKNIIKISTFFKKGFVEMIISDNGSGIDPDLRDNIFQPFFTTKNPDEHKGFGLVLSMKIIKDHHGELNFQSSRANGTTFFIKIKGGE